MNTKIIIELGCNHQGNVEIAKRMIDDANKLGVWGIKLQKRDIDCMPESLKTQKRSLENSFGLTYYEHRKNLEFTEKDFIELKKYAEQYKLKFICSAFDANSVEFLKTINCEYIKLPSQLYTDVSLKEKLLKNKNYKIVLSTGMHNFEEISTNNWLLHVDILMHCISVYPLEINEMNLITINALSKIADKYNFEIGYSSHDRLGLGVAKSVLCGAKYIERHYTLDKTMKGSDHSTVSSDYDEMCRIITEINEAEHSLGDLKRECSQKELKTRFIYRGF